MRRLLTPVILGTAAATFLTAAAIAEVKLSNNDHGSSVIHITNGDRGDFIVKGDGLDLTAKWDGEFDIAADGRGLESIDGQLRIESKEGSKKRKVAFDGDGKKFTASYSVNGKDQPIDAAAQDAIGDLLLQFVRASGYNADERVEALLKEGGPDAVIAEIGELIGGHAAKRYIEALADHARLSPRQIEQLSKHIAAQDGDHAKRTSIEALLSTQELSAESRAVLLQAAEGVTGDYDLRMLVEAVADQPLTEDAVATALAFMQRLSGDYDIRTAAESLLDNESLSDEAARELIETASGKLHGAYDLRSLVEAAKDHAGRSEVVAAALIDATARITSDHDQRLAVSALAEALPRNSGQWRPLIETAGEIPSGYDARLALEAIAEEMPGNSALEEAYRAAARSISDERDRDRALAVLEDR